MRKYGMVTGVPFPVGYGMEKGDAEKEHDKYLKSFYYTVYFRIFAASLDLALDPR